MTGGLAVAGTVAMVPFVDQIFNVEPGDVVTARVALVVVGLTTALTLPRQCAELCLVRRGTQ